MDTLPIFPLGTVLFPGGVLPLRIFEARYMDMARECLKTDSAFGVCLITRGNEVGQPADHEAQGCLAMIREWDMPQLGLLRIRTVGSQRFEILQRELQADGLIRAQIRLLAADPELPVPAPFGMLPQLVQRIVTDLVEEEEDPLKRMIADPYRYDDAAWVGNRLSEFLPLSMATRQRLMTLTDPLLRLSLIQQVLEQHQAL